MEMKHIGTIHTPFTDLAGMPIQPSGACGVKGTVEVLAEYRDSLKDIDGFSYIILLYHFHRSQGFNLYVVPFMDSEPRGVFATRAPKHPNSIGLSIVQLNRIEKGISVKVCGTCMARCGIYRKIVALPFTDKFFFHNCRSKGCLWQLFSAIL
jgi:tRNA-Thr(GGU) m(6)t(6)A37 methyltransferase TsaA